ncbi:MAG TPA: hypothetical protein VN893_03355 [Bryobacteraceae bacterium]|nr:hypothetical protein [Bryobacteraceae bacterium]
MVKQIFPQLRRLCESRGVTWGEVDLRWGVPDAAKAEGKVLPLCLAEIERCRPYSHARPTKPFLGSVGLWGSEELVPQPIDGVANMAHLRQVLARVG